MHIVYGLWVSVSALGTFQYSRFSSRDVFEDDTFKAKARDCCLRGDGLKIVDSPRDPRSL